MSAEPITTRADFAARVIAEIRAAGLQGDITHDEIAEKRAVRCPALEP